MGQITTLAQVRISVPRLASVVDAEVNRIIDECSDIIQSFCKTQFGSQTITEVKDLNSIGRIFLNNRPIISITSITTGLPSTPIVADPSTYQFDPHTGEVRGTTTGQFFLFNAYSFAGWYFPGAGSQTGFQTCQVVYVSGYPTVPPLVVGVCLRTLNRAVASLNNDPNIKSKRIGERSIDYANLVMTLSDQDRFLLCQNGYRTVSL